MPPEVLGNISLILRQSSQRHVAQANNSRKLPFSLLPRRPLSSELLLQLLDPSIPTPAVLIGQERTPILIMINGYMLTASKRTRNLQEIIIMSMHIKSWKCMTKETTTTKANTIGML